MSTPNPVFDKKRHIKYWKRCADLLPEQYTAGDGSRLSLAFFIIASLHLLDALETTFSVRDRQAWIDWIYSLQVASGGFRGFPGTNLGDRRTLENEHWDPANLHNTFMGLLTLLMLGDDLSRVRRKECLSWVKSLSRRNGSFGEMLGEGGIILGKSDLRSVYCAVGIVFILADRDTASEWLDKDDIVRHLSNCQDHDGAFGQSYLREAHAGLNFCGMATLELLDRLFTSEKSAKSGFASPLLDLEANIGWVLHRQTTWVNDDDSDSEDENEEDSAIDNAPHDEPQAIPVGFGGRCNKMADTCYCFWNGGALALLKKENLIEADGMRQYLHGSTQHMIGGFSKVPGMLPDLLHAYAGLAALAIVGEVGLETLDSALAVSQRTAARLKELRSSWSALKPD
ncbi:Geranylgeranyl transferase type-1 subunit beta [Cyphellophora attinorum]|uniref:Geranylgeranyl transferase type-1 subunit beta n=1 Tax=Cyphellophora attinorum TaxID=1664694 RepID=A0A0N1P0Y0_9EURO|nr:Geranylgeranyl transferase type-1 subunit beta [Phialophora attinorum]KPI39786.1 Geranylgeranyl transferase type-1 subunit beta [Phialophora attinorum]